MKTDSIQPSSRQLSRLEWTWERTDPRRSSSSGDLAKIFRHDETKNPGILAKDAPPDAATLLARELIQNSWDAARELATQQPGTPQFEIEFRFDRLVGDTKAKLVDALDLASLAERIPEIDRHRIGLREGDCLDSLADDETPLGILKVIEHGASGMYGPWQGARSHMYLALVSIGYTEKSSGSGGSYGYGKAGLINGSKIRSICAYTAFRERDDEPGVSRRLLGMTYWGQHQVGENSYTGYARLGQRDPVDREAISPFVNGDADRIARLIGLETRNPVFDSELGTTFLLIDPTIDPRDLVKAIERSWWPALVDGEFVATVVDYDGTTMHPRPRRDPVLKTFVDAWEIATGRSEPRRDSDWVADINGTVVKAPLKGPEVRLGRLGLVTDLSDWSYADQTTEPDEERLKHRSLVALARGPKMVVEYFDAGQSPPYVRGAFLADDAVNDLLLQTEPKAHDAWRTKNGEADMAPEAALAAVTVLRKIKSQVNNHRNRLKPPVPRAEDVDLPLFNDIMRRVLSGASKGTSMPTPDTRPITINMEYEPEPVGDSQLRVKGSVRFALADHFTADEALTDIAISYRFIEDDRVGTTVSLKIRPPSAQGFAEVRPGVYRGLLRREEYARFEFSTEPYDLDWSGRLIVSGNLAGESDEEARPV